MVGQVLKMSPGVFILGNPTLENVMYVRPEYEPLVQRVITMWSSTKRGIAILGTPGIGLISHTWAAHGPLILNACKT